MCLIQHLRGIFHSLRGKNSLHDAHVVCFINAHCLQIELTFLRDCIYSTVLESS